MLASSASAKTMLQFLQDEPKPQFRKGHSLLHLTRWGYVLPYEVAVELATHWGYAVEYGAYATPEHVSDLDDPNSDHARLCALTASNPKRFPLSVLPDRPDLFNSKFIESLPPETWCRDEKGEFLLMPNGSKVWSPEAPDEVFRLIGEETIKPLRAILKKCPITYVLHGGERGLGVPGFAQELWAKDPRIVAAKGQRDWFEYISRQKARQEKFTTDAVKRLLPKSLYLMYPTAGMFDRHRYGHWWQWGWDYKFLRVVSDLPNASLYYREFNTGWTGDMDLLTQTLNCVGQQIACGDPLAYNWVAGGHMRDAYSDMEHYMGYLKCLYTSGMVGAAALYGKHEPPPRDLATADLGDTPPSWVAQLMVLSRAHALFTHRDDFLRNGDLLPGPSRHRWSKDQPAYEFPTGDLTVRVLARKHRAKRQWLVTAWAADGPAREVEVEIPELGKIKLQARAAGNVYVVQPGKAPKLHDTDAMRPSVRSTDFSRNPPARHKPAD